MSGIEQAQTDLRIPLRQAVMAPGRALAISLAYVALYVLLDWGSYFHALAKVGITPWNPPPALSLILLLLFGLNFGPLLYVAGVAAEIVVRGVPFPAAALWSALAPTIGYVFAVWLLRVRLDFDLAITRQRDLVMLILVSAIVAPLVAAGAVLPYYLSGVIGADEIVAGVINSAVGDFVGIVVTVPLILRLRHVNLRTFVTWETLGQTVIVAVVVWSLFAADLEPGSSEFKYFYLLFLPLTWIALRQGLSGAAVACLLIQMGIVATTVLNPGNAPRALDLQLLMLALAVTGLITGVIVDERRSEDIMRRRLSDQLAHLARLSLSGEIASSLAHELNQPLGAVVNYLRAGSTMLERGSFSDLEVRTTLGKAEAQALRAGEALRRFRDFLKRGEVKLSTLEVSGVVANAVALVATVARGHAIDIRVSPGLSGLWIIADRVQMTQILLNLLINAVEAIVQDGDHAGWIEISARRTGDRQVEIRVSDSASGIALDDRDRIFDSFFTTKDDGMGLGLAISKSLIEAQAGRIWYVPRRDEVAGAFHVTIPMSGRTDD